MLSQRTPRNTGGQSPPDPRRFPRLKRPLRDGFITPRLVSIGRQRSVYDPEARVARHLPKSIKIECTIASRVLIENIHDTRRRIQ